MAGFNFAYPNLLGGNQCHIETNGAKGLLYCLDIFFYSSEDMGYIILDTTSINNSWNGGHYKSQSPRHKRNVFCLPRQRAFLLAFQAKNGQKQAFSGSNAVNRLQRSPIFCYQNAKTVENAGILFAFLCSAKNTKKVRVGRI